MPTQPSHSAPASADSCDNALQAAMDPNELIKAAPELAKGAGAIAAAVPFTAIVKRMLGPAADELAEMLRDQVRLYRYERQIKCLEKAERMAKEAGFTPQAVPPKILFPLLEGVSFEENNTLHTMWASLLANASDPTWQGVAIQPSFIDLLKQLTPDQAIFLDALFTHTIVKSQKLRHSFHEGAGLPDPTLMSIYPVASPTELFAVYCRALNVKAADTATSESTISWRRQIRRQYSLTLDNLFRLRLLRERQGAEPNPEADPEEKAMAEHFYIAASSRMFYFSTLGFEFIASCSPPKPKENG